MMNQPRHHDDGGHLVGEDRSHAHAEDGEEGEDQDHPGGHRGDLVDHVGEGTAPGGQGQAAADDGGHQQDHGQHALRARAAVSSLAGDAARADRA